jgi:tetratricopeptide (TPR) repeat protein
MNNRFSKVMGLAAATLTLAGTMVFAPAPQVRAESILEEQGTLRPAEDEYAFDAEAGQVLAIVMDSDEFDTVLTLLGPDKEEVAFNDDAGGTLNSRIIYSVTTTGTYTVVARSYSGAGGNYKIEVRPATAYEVGYESAQASMMDGDYSTAIAEFTDLIALDPSNPEAYLSRVDAYFSQAYQQLEAEGRFFEGPDDLDPDVRATVVSDLETVSGLYAELGDAYAAESFASQAEFIRTGTYPEEGPF